ncbi:MAG: hypothetical protein GX236_02870 [Clostridiaceae bacterium]|nr:hypothetical protein [Clostridiaceae bacterium]
MKNYVKPVFEYVELRMDERMAGSCAIPIDPRTGKPYPHGMCPTGH